MGVINGNSLRNIYIYMNETLRLEPEIVASSSSLRTWEAEVGGFSGLQGQPENKIKREKLLF